MTAPKPPVWQRWVIVVDDDEGGRICGRLFFLTRKRALVELDWIRHAYPSVAPNARVQRVDITPTKRKTKR